MSSLSRSLRVVLACMTAPFSMWPCEESPLVPASFVRLLRTTALKRCFLALDGHLQAPLTYFEGAGKCQKWRFLSLEWCFLALGGHL